MTSSFTSALIIGAGRGAGRAVARSLAQSRVGVTAVARTAADLETLAAEAPGVTPFVADAASGIARELMEKTKPDLIVLAGGARPRMGPFFDQNWDSFSTNWNADTKITFDFLKAAIEAPMAPGGVIVTLSSGAAISGSSLSGGYAGAKRMQHYLTNYAAFEAGRRNLGLRCYTLYPQQFITGTEIADTASQAYADLTGVTQEEFMAQWEKPLTPEVLASYVTTLADPDAGHEPGAYGARGVQMAALA